MTTTHEFEPGTVTTDDRRSTEEPLRWATDTADVLWPSLVPNHPREQLHGAADALPGLNQGVWPRMLLQRHSVAAKRLSQAGGHRILTTVDMAGSTKMPEAYADSIVGFDR
jgi:hypothetical protein